MGEEELIEMEGKQGAPTPRKGKWRGEIERGMKVHVLGEGERANPTITN